MMVRLVLLAAGGIGGLAIGWLLWGSAQPAAKTSAPPPAEAPVADEEVASPSETIASLRDDLAREVARRTVLEEQVEILLAEPTPEPERRGRAPSAAAAGSKRAAKTGRSAPSSSGWIRDDVLLRAGFAPAEVDELRERFEAIELERLYVRDRATREGWVDKPRYRRRMARLNENYDALRGEWGDAAYDWILFASGRNNRVSVERVLQGSAAGDAGLQAGDVIVTYDDVPVFDPKALREATTSGDVGETVSVEVERGGERHRYFVDRGPLGIGLQWKRLEPAESR